MTYPLRCAFLLWLCCDEFFDSVEKDISNSLVTKSRGKEKNKLTSHRSGVACDDSWASVSSLTFEYWKCSRPRLNGFGAARAVHLYLISDKVQCLNSTGQLLATEYSCKLAVLTAL